MVGELVAFRLEDNSQRQRVKVLVETALPIFALELAAAVCRALLVVTNPGLVIFKFSRFAQGSN